MKLFEIEDGTAGAVRAVMFTGGKRVATVRHLADYLEETEGDIYYGDGVHRVAHTLISVGAKVRVYAKSRTGEILSIKVGAKGSRMVDIGAWNLGLKVDQDEGMLKHIQNDKGVITSTPTPLTTNSYRKAVYQSGCFDYAQLSKVSLMEAVLSSTRIPTRGFKPAYGGGLISSPADPNRIYEDVTSFDIASSYPWSAATTAVPYGSSRSFPEDMLGKIKIIDGTIDLGGAGFIGLFKFKNMRRRDWVRIPLVKSKDEDFTVGGEFDSIGMVSAEIFRAALSPADLKGLSIQYTWEDVLIEKLEVHRIQRLPEGIRSFLGKLFSDKESKRGEDRLRAKLAINTIIGLWGTDPFKSGLRERLKDGLYTRSYPKNLIKPWEHYVGDENKGMTSGGFRCWDFRWAVYAVAAARLRIVQTEKALHDAGLEVLYCDTDSIKVHGDRSVAASVFESMNERVHKANAILDLPSGMGKWVDESRGYSRAVFRGRKFYAREDEYGNRSSYIAGTYKQDADNLIQSITLEDLALLDEVVISTTRPDFGELKDDPFGAGYQELMRPVEYRYTKKELLISVI